MVPVTRIDAGLLAVTVLSGRPRPHYTPLNLCMRLTMAFLSNLLALRLPAEMTSER